MSYMELPIGNAVDYIERVFTMYNNQKRQLSKHNCSILFKAKFICILKMEKTKEHVKIFGCGFCLC